MRCCIRQCTVLQVSCCRRQYAIEVERRVDRTILFQRQPVLEARLHIPTLSTIIAYIKLGTIESRCVCTVCNIELLNRIMYVLYAIIPTHY